MLEAAHIRDVAIAATEETPATTENVPAENPEGAAAIAEQLRELGAEAHHMLPEPVQEFLAAQSGSDLAVMGTTTVLGGAGIHQIVQGQIDYSRGEGPRGAKRFVKGNLWLTGSAAINETILGGHPHTYTVAEIPFLLSGLREHITQNKVGSEALQNLAKKYSAAPALILNVILHSILLATSQGAIGVTELLRHAGFAGLSTSFVMKFGDEEKGEVSKRVGANLSASQERFLTSFGTRGALIGALVLNVRKSLHEVGATGDIGLFDLLAVIWIVLNLYGVYGDVVGIRNSFRNKALATVPAEAE